MDGAGATPLADLAEPDPAEEGGDPTAGRELLATPDVRDPDSPAAGWEADWRLGKLRMTPFGGSADDPGAPLRVPRRRAEGFSRAIDRPALSGADAGL